MIGDAKIQILPTESGDNYALESGVKEGKSSNCKNEAVDPQTSKDVTIADRENSNPIELVEVNENDSNRTTEYLKLHLVSLISGLLFGVAIERSRISVPYTISMQMSFSNFVMMRMFLGACVTSVAMVTVLHLLKLNERVPKDSTRIGICIRNRFSANMLGGWLLGAGMALSGACPGTVFPQIGTDPGIRVGLIVAGGVTAVLLFGYVHKKMSSSYEDFLEKIPGLFRGNQTILNVLSMAAIISMIAVIALLNYFFPWEDEMETIVDGNVTLDDFIGAGDSELGIWDPLYAGVLVGALQLLSFLSNGCALGMSTGWLFPAYCIARIFDKNVAQNAPYLLKYSSWQAVCAIGAILGSYLSSSYLNISSLSAEALAFQSDNADVYVRSFFGGFLILFGARIGNGCTSGHGLSGIALMSMGSMVSVGFMFLGGLVTSALFFPNRY